MQSMNDEEKEVSKMTTDTSTDAENKPAEDESLLDSIDRLQDDIIRNDTIPETSRTTPGSSGAFPVGAFENNKD